MSNVLALTNRHIKNYLRDKVSVFFSFLSIIILLSIYLLFLGDMIGEIPGLSSAENSRFTLGYIMGGVLVVGTITLPLGALGVYVSDLEKRRLDSFLVMPTSRKSITISYVLATFVVSLALVLIMFAFTIIYIGATTGLWFSLAEILQMIGVLSVFVAISSPIVLFAISFIKSMGAFGGLSSVLGTVIGFISGIYIPLSVLDSVTAAIASLLPFSHMTILMRRLLVGDGIISKIPQEALSGAGVGYIDILGNNINIWAVLAIFLAVSAVFLALSYFRISKKHSK